MSRRRKKTSLVREVSLDPMFKDSVVSKFINKLMWDGHKEKARSILYQSFEEIKKTESKEEPLSVFKTAIANCKPSLEVRSRRVGGATYQVPVDVRPSRKLALAMNWIIENSRSRKGKPMFVRLANELMDAYNNRGNSVKKKEDVHRMAESNRAFSHYNW